MLPESYRKYEVKRAASALAMHNIKRGVYRLAHQFEHEPSFEHIRPSGTKCSLTLLGLYKIEYALNHSNHGSELRKNPQATIGKISTELLQIFAQPIDVTIDSYSVETEKRRQTKQAVLYANLDPSLVHCIGQEYASQRLSETSENEGLLPYLPRVPLLFASEQLLLDNGAQEKLLLTAERTLRMVGNISYSGAL